MVDIHFRRKNQHRRIFKCDSILPLTYLGVHGFMLKKIGSYKNKEIILIIVKMSFLFSCIIEILQRFFKVRDISVI